MLRHSVGVTVRTYRISALGTKRSFGIDGIFPPHHYFPKETLQPMLGLYLIAVAWSLLALSTPCRSVRDAIRAFVERVNEASVDLLSNMPAQIAVSSSSVLQRSSALGLTGPVTSAASAILACPLLASPIKGTRRPEVICFSA